MTTRVLIVLATLFLAGAARASAQAQPPVPTPADSAAIRQAALDYIEGWYEGDGDRMARAVHPDLAKRQVVSDGGHFWMGDASASNLVTATRAGYGRRVPAERRRKDVQILDVYGGMASVRLTSGELVDYMHLALWDGRWKIVNVLWDFQPEFRPKRD